MLRESQNTQSKELRFHALLIEGDADRLAFMELFQSSDGVVVGPSGHRVPALVIIDLNALLFDEKRSRRDWARAG